jgi:hypothetical protein
VAENSQAFQFAEKNAVSTGAIPLYMALTPCVGQGGSDIKKTGNLRTVQRVLGHTMLERTVRYLGVEMDDALSLSEAEI